MRKKCSVLAILVLYSTCSIAEHCPLDTSFTVVNGSPAIKKTSHPFYCFGFACGQYVDQPPKGNTWALTETASTDWDSNRPERTTGNSGEFWPYEDSVAIDITTQPADALLTVEINNLGSIQCVYSTNAGNISLTPKDKSHSVNIDSAQFGHVFQVASSTSQETIYKCTTTAPKAEECSWEYT